MNENIPMQRPPHCLTAVAKAKWARSTYYALKEVADYLAFPELAPDTELSGRIAIKNTLTTRVHFRKLPAAILALSARPVTFL